MGQPYVGEIRMFGGNFAPAGWQFCEGQLLPISENETLFQLIGTTYGGDGQSTFALPDLRGRAPMHLSSANVIATTGGVETVTLTPAQTPHDHGLVGTGDVANTTSPGSNVTFARTGNTTIVAYGSDAPLGSLAPSSVSPVGGGQPHDNMQPYLCVSFIISLFGIFPSPT
jgi:microcystin-dependent protein